MARVMLAATYEDQDISGYLSSEKLDGMRCVWDGGVTRGRKTDGDVATGLTSRNGKIIHAPNEWLDALPKGVALDGELWLGRGRFQETMSIVRRKEPGPKWGDVTFRVFEIPDNGIGGPDRSFGDKLQELASCGNDVVRAVEQSELSSCLRKARKELKGRLLSVISAGGEGLMLRCPNSTYRPGRSRFLLKVKKQLDAEAKIVGAVAGKGQFAGMLGALRVEFMGKRFNLSGFVVKDRQLEQAASRWAIDNAGAEMPVDLHPRRFGIAIATIRGDRRSGATTFCTRAL